MLKYFIKPSPLCRGKCYFVCVGEHTGVLASQYKPEREREHADGKTKIRKKTKKRKIKVKWRNKTLCPCNVYNKMKVKAY